MSIYIKDSNGELASYSYKKALISYVDGMFDFSLIWLEGTDINPLDKKSRGRNSVGGLINTNSGIAFTKEDLLKIAEILPEGGTLNFAALNRKITFEEIKKEFDHDNNMVKIAPYTFCPSENVDEILERDTENKYKRYEHSSN